MDRFDVGDQVKIKTEYKKLNGKMGKVSKVYKWECDVKVDRNTYLIHKKSLTKSS
jgi:hypothetical protein